MKGVKNDDVRILFAKYVCFSVLQCVAVSCRMLLNVAEYNTVLHWATLVCSWLH